MYRTILPWSSGEPHFHCHILPFWGGTIDPVELPTHLLHSCWPVVHRSKVLHRCQGERSFWVWSQFGIGGPHHSRPHHYKRHSRHHGYTIVKFPVLNMWMFLANRIWIPNFRDWFVAGRSRMMVPCIPTEHRLGRSHMCHSHRSNCIG